MTLTEILMSPLDSVPDSVSIRLIRKISSNRLVSHLKMARWGTLSIRIPFRSGTAFEMEMLTVGLTLLKVFGFVWFNVAVIKFGHVEPASLPNHIFPGQA